MAHEPIFRFISLHGVQIDGQGFPLTHTHVIADETSLTNFAGRIKSAIEQGANQETIRQISFNI